jgi:Protein of unknown function (DUF2634)
MLLGIDIDFTELKEEDNVILTKRDYGIFNGRITGFVDNAEAVQQACKKAFNTERFMFDAYNFDYGIELIDTIGKDKDYVIADLKRRFEEAITNIKGAESVSDFLMGKTQDGLSILITILTEYGEIQIEEEVTL